MEQMVDSAVRTGKKYYWRREEGLSNSQESREGSCALRNELERWVQFPQTGMWGVGLLDAGISTRKGKSLEMGTGMLVILGHEWPGGQWVDFACVGRVKRLVED